MPTSIWGVAFYVFALFPGVAFVFAREGHQAVGKRSALRETANVIFVSAICDAVVALVIVVLAAMQPEVQAVITSLLAGDLSWARQNFGLATIYAILALASATGLGFLLGSKWAHDHGLKAIWKSAIPRDVSAWQKILLPDTKLEVRVGLNLKSGYWISGTLWDFDNDPDPNPHRTITLSGNITARANGEEKATPLDQTDWLVVEAGEIEMLQASYYEPVEGLTSDDPSRTSRAKFAAASKRGAIWCLILAGGVGTTSTLGFNFWGLATMLTVAFIVTAAVLAISWTVLRK